MLQKLASGSAALLLTGAVSAAPVDLSTWTSDLHTGPAASGGATWTVQSGANPNDSVFQSTNGSPTVFYDSGTNAQGTSLAGSIAVETTSDDDFIGFVLGYDDNELNGTDTDFYLIDWKQRDQSISSFGFAPEGLAISHVTTPSRGLWGKDSASESGVAEIARATNLGSTGWIDNQVYNFALTFTSSLIEVFVDSVLELSVTAGEFGLSSFDDGAFGFYNYSQSRVRYAGITEDVLPDPCLANPGLPQCNPSNDPPGPTPVPAPAGILLLSLGLLGFRLKGHRLN